MLDHQAFMKYVKTLYQNVYDMTLEKAQKELDDFTSLRQKQQDALKNDQSVCSDAQCDGSSEAKSNILSYGSGASG